jgi:hypothetical protein
VTGVRRRRWRLLLTLGVANPDPPHRQPPRLLRVILGHEGPALSLVAHPARPTSLRHHPPRPPSVRGSGCPSTRTPFQNATWFLIRSVSGCAATFGVWGCRFAAAAIVRSVAGGNETVPTVVVDRALHDR